MSRPEKLRLDRLLVERGLAESGARAQALVLAGRVFRGEQRLDKPGTMLAADAELTVRAVEDHVGRGAHKLIAGLDDPSVAAIGSGVPAAPGCALRWFNRGVVEPGGIEPPTS